MTRIITCLSGKGGVGKTTLVANLGVALAGMGMDVVVLDANLTTPNLGLHLGIPLSPTTLHDVLKGNAKLIEATYLHDSGLKIIPAGISLKDMKGIDSRELPNILLELLGSTDIVLIDAAAGLGREALAAIEAADELLLITNPELPAVTDALKAAKLAEQVGTKVSGLVVNRITKKPHEMTRSQIAGMLEGIDVLAEIPEDIAVQESIAKRTPVVSHKPRATSSQTIRRLAASLIGEEIKIERPWHQRLFGFLR
ncbi:MAG: cell division ATPase MinD [Candidatus Aenigmarchaeota archaeon]|nr:cell division ATPase MinD [Candidatus Aenigmarchaeota archaeon]